MRTALVTGANRGIGREVAQQLAARGFHVFVGARDAGAGRATVEAIARVEGKASFLQLDVADDASVAAAAREFAKTEQRLDVVVNNAGVLLRGDGNILRIDEEIVRASFETNTLGALRVTRAFAPVLAKSAAPRVINVSSGGGQLAGGAEGWMSAYCISKTALNAVTLHLAHALPKFAVNSVTPGWVRTDMGSRLAPRSVEEGAETIVWLATEASPQLTGKFWRDRQEIPW